MARWEGFLPDVPSHPPVDAAWAKLKQQWEDDVAHRQFLDQAAQFDGLDVAAALYRGARRERPDDARAEDGLRRAALLAQNLYAAKSQAERTRMPSQIMRVLGVVGAMMVIASALATFYFLFRRHR